MVILRVEVLPGTSINDAAKQMIGFANKLGVMATTSFNGFHVIAHPNNNAGEIVDQYNAWCVEESKRYRAGTPHEVANEQ